MKLLLPLLIAIGMGALAFVQTKKTEAATDAAAQVKEQFEFLQANHNATEAQLKDSKQAIQENTKRIGELETKAAEARSQVAETQARLQESQRQATSLVAGGDELKKQLNDLLALRDKLATAESQLASSKHETTAVEEKLTTANAEIARLKAAAALPPIGSAMDRKR